MRLIDADALWHDEDTTNDYAEGNDDGKRIIMNMIDSAPTIGTRQVKYYDEDENVWKIGEVIVDEID